MKKRIFVLLILIFAQISCNGSSDAVKTQPEAGQGGDERPVDNPVDNPSEDTQVSIESLCADPSLITNVAINPTPLTGTEITTELLSSGGTTRDSALIDKALCGHLPAVATFLQEVSFQVGNEEIIICVSPDYLSWGIDSDNVRFPMGLPATEKLLGEMGFILPTAKMVDAIYEQAQYKLAPKFMKPGPQMESTDYINTHDQTIDLQLSVVDDLVGGHKKDLVVSNRLVTRPTKVAIYGWHKLNGNPVQPLSTVHHKNYADYSHGIRLVSQTAFLDGQEVSLKSLLRSSKYAPSISHEGKISQSLLDKFKSQGLSCPDTP